MNQDSQFPSSNFEEHKDVLAEDTTSPGQFWNIVKQDLAAYALLILISASIGFCFGVASTI